MAIPVLGIEIKVKYYYFLVDFYIDFTITNSPQGKKVYICIYVYISIKHYWEAQPRIWVLFPVHG